ncbi:MAG: glycosyltransferase [Lachnospiraceae bacterium]|jgi:putative colanic acid biosynthesis glycosyltransferase|nr:glycosyltransferase [Lachnospiraceae bacterium]
MKVLLINETCGIGSHGRICKEIADTYKADGHKVVIAFGRNGKIAQDCEKYAFRIGNDVDVYIHALYTRILDRHGFGSKNATKRFIKWAENYNPDVIWLHNIHGYYINIELLFGWIKHHPEKEIRWTLHDCWAFTGHCGHFLVSDCKKWKKGCYECPEKHQYPKSLFLDNSQQNYKRKRVLFGNIEKMNLITPSEWLRDQVKQSFLQEYPIEVMRNKIDTKTFKFTESDLRDKLDIRNKYVILGVASKWTCRKGVNDFFKLATLLDHRFKIIMVGLTQSQMKRSPKEIIGIQHTEDAKQLAQFYSMADVFINLTYEENYPTVNLEAEACGTPVITYDTGGCKETLMRKESKVVETGKLSEIIRLLENKYSENNEIRRGTTLE